MLNDPLSSYYTSYDADPINMSSSSNPYYNNDDDDFFPHHYPSYYAQSFPTIPFQRRLGRQQMEQLHAQRAFEEYERRRQYQLEQELLQRERARQRSLLAAQARIKREQEEERRRHQYHQMILEEKRRQMMEKERERLLAEREAQELAQRIRLNSMMKKMDNDDDYDYEPPSSPRRYHIVQGPGGALYQVMHPETKEKYIESSYDDNDDEDWDGFVKRNLRRTRSNKPNVRFVQKNVVSSPLNKVEASSPRYSKNEQQQESSKMKTIPVMKVLPHVQTTKDSEMKSVVSGPYSGSRIKVQSSKTLNKKHTVKSEVMYGEVEDASDDEMEDSNSIWTNRRPSEGQWMEPIMGFHQ